MTDTQHLQMTDYLPTDAALTPLRGGHRHKRSFAISGDFDFLKQPVSLPPLPCNTPEVPKDQIDKFSGPGYCPEIVIEQTLASHKNELATSMDPKSEETSALSPRFFISEEPRFSSPFRGVPDAIINLDDALKTKPKCFKSHRRSESAPADLAVLLGTKTVSNSDQMIEEEDDDNDNDEYDSYLRTDPSGSDALGRATKATLLSPLRPTSPLSTAHLHDLTLDGSPVRSNRDNRSDNFNSLKISRQKQRYYQYTKKIPIGSSCIQTQSLREKASSNSLSSACMRTPHSSFQTPSKQVSTPPTPVSAGFNSSQSQYESSSRLTSPFRSQNVHSNMRNANSSSFKYEPKVYDMPHGRMNSESVSSRDDRTLYKKEMSFTDRCDATDEDGSGDESNREEREKLPISRELLFGEPGEAVDLSSFSSPIKETFIDYRSSSNEEVLSPIRHNTGNYSESLSPTNDTPDSRSVSDTLLVMQKTRKEKRKVTAIEKLKPARYPETSGRMH